MDSDEQWKNNGQGVQSDRPTDRSKKDCWGEFSFDRKPKLQWRVAPTLTLARVFVCFSSPPPLIAAHVLADEYIEMAGTVALHQMGHLGPYGMDPARTQYPLEAVSVLRYLQSPLRRPTILETWSPIEIALFEAALSEHGKEFHMVQREIRTKTTREVIDFYYIWKKTKHYVRWKKQYVPPHLDVPNDDDHLQRHIQNAYNSTTTTTSSSDGGGAAATNGRKSKKPPTAAATTTTADRPPSRGAKPGGRAK